MTAAISIQNLSKSYGRFRALENVTFDIQPGEFFGLLGPNGAGKTTTIRIITGLANYQKGRVSVFGHDVRKEYRESRALVGLAPQEFNFDPFLSVEQILTFEGGYFGLPWTESKKRTHAMMDLFDLSDKRRDGYKKLSGGMKRRLLIARALMHRPRILILDEPTAGVDLELRHFLWSFFRKINQEGTTIVLTTHYLEEAEKLCGRIGVIHKGSLAALDTTESLIRKISGDQVELYLKNRLTILPSEITEVPVLIEADGKKIRFEEKGEAVNRVLKGLHKHGIEVDRIDVRRPTLEDAFMQLTKKNTNP